MLRNYFFTYEIVRQLCLEINRWRMIMEIGRLNDLVLYRGDGSPAAHRPLVAQPLRLDALAPAVLVEAVPFEDEERLTTHRSMKNGRRFDFLNSLKLKQ